MHLILILYFNYIILLFYKDDEIKRKIKIINTFYNFFFIYIKSNKKKLYIYNIT